MIYLDLFWTFFKIGLFTFGGGYSMIPLIQDAVLTKGWLTEEMIVTFIGVGESTPGPIAVNIATFIGASQAGILGSVCATLGVVLPSFFIILLIASIFSGFRQNNLVQGVLSGVKPVVIAFIVATGLMICIGNVYLNYNDFHQVAAQFDWRALIITGVLAAFMSVMKFGFKKKTSPILLILLAAGLGMLVYSL